MHKCPKCGTEYEGNFCTNCGEKWQEEKICPNCGAKSNGFAKFCTNCGYSFQNLSVQSRPANQVSNQPTNATVQGDALSSTGNSKFTGGAFSNFFRHLALKLVSAITLGLAYPAMKCWLMHWETEHTIINGKKLTFDGTGSQLFGNYIKWLLLSIVTLGIYYLFAMQTNLMKWQTKHTHFEGENNTSVFTGTALGYLGVKVIALLVTVCTLFIGSFWATCYKNRWIASKKIIDGKQLAFDGKAMQYFGKRIIWLLLTVVTIGIYSFWLTVKSKDWITSHTYILGEANVNDYDTSVQQPITEPNKEESEKQQNGTITEQEAIDYSDAKNPCAIVGCILSITPFALIGIILSIVGLVKSKKMHGKGRGFAIAGIIIPFLASLITFILIKFL